MGLVLGMGGAVAATRLMMGIGILVQVSPNDPVVFVGIALILSIVGTLACWLPARRAACLHPVAALREE
jgi:ABC-type lipoprotein release transport system permease subunit